MKPEGLDKETLEKLPYLKAVVKEALRMAGPAAANARYTWRQVHLAPGTRGGKYTWRKVHLAAGTHGGRYTRRQEHLAAGTVHNTHGGRYT